MLDDVQQLYWHRGESHSIFFVLIGGALLGALLWRAMAGMVLIMATHVLIDYFNITGYYSGSIFWIRVC